MFMPYITFPFNLLKLQHEGSLYNSSMQIRAPLVSYYPTVI